MTDNKTRPMSVCRTNRILPEVFSHWMGRQMTNYWTSQYLQLPTGQDLMRRISFEKCLEGSSITAGVTSNRGIRHRTGRPIDCDLPHQYCTSTRRSVSLGRSPTASHRIAPRLDSTTFDRGLAASSSTVQPYLITS
jgi:hypothetical protein